MSRKGPSKTRKITSDTIYHSLTVSKLINYVMKAGQKNVARKTSLSSPGATPKKPTPKTDVIDLLDQALDNIKPKIEVRPRRIGGAVYQVPAPVRAHRQDSLSIRWLVGSARQRPNKQYHTFAEKLAAELIDALDSQGGAVSKRVGVEKMAEANKAFSHLRWWSFSIILWQMSLFSKTHFVLWPQKESTEIYSSKQENNTFSFDISLWKEQSPQDLRPLILYLQKNK